MLTMTGAWLSQLVVDQTVLKLKSEKKKRKNPWWVSKTSKKNCSFWFISDAED